MGRLTQDGWVLVIDGSEPEEMQEAHCRRLGWVFCPPTSDATDAQPSIHDRGNRQGQAPSAATEVRHQVLTWEMGGSIHVYRVQSDSIGVWDRRGLMNVRNK